MRPRWGRGLPLRQLRFIAVCGDTYREPRTAQGVSLAPRLIPLAAAPGRSLSMPITGSSKSPEPYPQVQGPASESLSRMTWGGEGWTDWVFLPHPHCPFLNQRHLGWAVTVVCHPENSREGREKDVRNPSEFLLLLVRRPEERLQAGKAGCHQSQSLPNQRPGWG